MYKKFVLMILALVIVVLFTFTAHAQELRIFDQQVYSDIQDYQNGSLIIANSNLGGASIPYTYTSEIAITKSMYFTIICSALSYANATLGRSEGETRTLTYGGSGSIEAPPANAPSGSVNYGVVFLGYTSTRIRHEKWQYYVLDNGRVMNGEQKQFPEQYSFADILQTCKCSQANYGLNNYPRPNPWVGHKTWDAIRPSSGTLAINVGIHTMFNNTDHDMS